MSVWLWLGEVNPWNGISIICVICCQLAKFILKRVESVIDKDLQGFIQTEIMVACFLRKGGFYDRIGFETSHLL